MKVNVLSCLAAAALLASAAFPVSASPSQNSIPSATAAGDAPIGQFTFVVYGDTRSIAADHRKVVAQIMKLHPEFVLQTGDLVADGSSPTQWDEYNAIVAPMKAAGIANYPARGNHDLGPYFASEVPSGYDSGNGYYYAFTRHNCRFIMLDSMDPDQFAIDSPQYLWVKNELANAEHSTADAFVVFHEPPFSVGPHGPTPDTLTNLHPLFKAYRPRIVFCGHDHLYYHTTRDGVTYLVSGGGGAPLYEPVRARKVAISGDVYANAHHVIVCTVTGSRVDVTVIALDGDRELTKTNKPFVPGDTPPSLYVVGPSSAAKTAIPPTDSGFVIDRFRIGG